MLLFAGRKKYQKFFEALNLFALRGMNIGGGRNPQISGEKTALQYVHRRLSGISPITIFDVGANLGQSFLAEREVFGSNAEIYSFEPSLRTFTLLEENVKSTRDKVRLYNFGFGNKNEKITLYSNKEGSGLASVYQRKLDHFNVVMDKKEIVELRTLDSFCREQKIHRIHFLKLDVEGNEIKVLEGAKQLLGAGLIDFIQFEFGGCNIDSRTYFQDFFYLLKDQFKIYRIVRDGLFEITQYKEMYEAFATTNYLAEKK